MNLGSTRDLSGLKAVLKDPSDQPENEAVYWVFNDLSEHDWENMTIIAPGTYTGEYKKTYGHYHPEDAVTEIYHLMAGEGVLQLQKKHVENGQLDPTRVDEVYLVRAGRDDEIAITPEWGHAWINIGKEPLVSVDNWRSGHTPADYEPIEQMQGMAYYLVEENGQVQTVPNPKYVDLPEPQWVSAAEFKNRHP